MKKDLNYYLNLPYKIELRKIADDEGGGWGAFMPEFKGYALFWGDGDTKEEALNDLDAVFKSTLESMLEHNDFIPEPASDRKIRVNVSLSQSLLNAIDKVTNNRSQFLSEAANLKLKGI